MPINIDNFPGSGPSWPKEPHLQSMVVGIRELDARSRNYLPSSSKFPTFKIGVIVNTDPSGATSSLANELYWVQDLTNVSSSGRPMNFAQTNIQTTDSDGNPVGTNVYLVTNLPELPAPSGGTITGGTGTHNLQVGTVVMFWPETDTGGNIHYVMSTGLPQGLFPVNLSQTGGPAGSSSAYCSFTYAAYYRKADNSNGAQIGTVTILSPNMSPARIVKIECTAAAKGQGYFDSTGTFVLEIAYEIAANQDNCS